jgi:hypothetical protein
MSEEKALITRKILTKKVNHAVADQEVRYDTEPVANKWEQTLDDFADDPDYEEVYNFVAFQRF